MSRVINNYFDGLQVTSRHKSIYFVIMFAYFFEQFDNWNFGYVVPSIMQAMHLDMSAIGTITFWYFIGMMTGSIIGGILADMLGRKNAFQLGVLIFSGSSVVCGFADNIHLLTVARAMTGFGVMCVNMSAIPYLTEISPAEARGKWQNLTAAVGMIGVPVVGVLCRIVLPLSTDAWRWVFYAGGAGVLLFFGAHRVLLESPRWLMARDRRAEAESVVREISGVDVELSQVKLEKGGVKPPLSEMLLGLFSREYIRTSLVVILPFLILGPATYIFQNWTTTLFKSQGFSLEDSLTITLFMQLGIPVGLFAFSYLSELGGRKLPIVISFFSWASRAWPSPSVRRCGSSALWDSSSWGAFRVWFTPTLPTRPNPSRPRSAIRGWPCCRPDAGLRHRFPSSSFPVCTRSSGFRESSTHSSCCASSRPCSSPSSPSVRQAGRWRKSENGRKHPQRCVLWASAREQAGL